MKYLFVCTGNTCRSPMAEAIARHLGLDASSAGLSAFVGDDIHADIADILRANQIRLPAHTAIPFTKALGEAAEVIYVMTEDHLDFIRMRYPALVQKTYLLGDGIPDPLGKGPKAVEDCFETMKTYIQSIA